MSEYLDEALWRENYRDLAAAVGMIREAAEQAFGPLGLRPNPKRTASTIEDCERIAQSIMTYASTTRQRIAELEEQVALTSRVEIQGVTEDVPPLACD